jgi:hypothetical protein
MVAERVAADPGRRLEQPVGEDKPFREARREL